MIIQNRRFKVMKNVRYSNRNDAMRVYRSAGKVEVTMASKVKNVTSFTKTVLSFKTKT